MATQVNDAVAELRQAISRNDLQRVIALMSGQPALHRAPLGYAADGPLTMVAEWRGSGEWGDVGGGLATRLAMARWMIENGSDVHQGGDGPLMRAALSGERAAMMELLVQYGANVNAVWHDEFPIIFAPCETVDPVALQWLLDHGANPNCADPQRKYSGTALDYVIGCYVRSPELRTCIDLLVANGGATRFDSGPVLDVLCGRMNSLVEKLEADPGLVRRRFPELDFGTTGGRMLTLRGATLLHVAAEYQNLEATVLLLQRGADVNARATVDESGVGGQTAIFHAVTQNGDKGLPVARVLVEHGADLSLRVKIPGHYERPDEVVECTPLGYATLFENEPGPAEKVETVAYLRRLGARR
jgi:ankyrin repeat protein